MSPSGSNAGGLSWATAFNHPQAAVDAADGGGEVWVAAGTYKTTDTADRTISFVMRQGVDIYGGFAGFESSRGQRDRAANETVLSGDIAAPGVAADNAYHVVIGASNATLDGFTVTGGNADGSWPDEAGGGGMYNTLSSPDVTDCTFSGNRAWAGGGMYNDGASPTLAGCTFTGNSTGSGGGGMANYSSSPSITGCTFTGNSAGSGGWGGPGGGMSNSFRSSPLVTRCTFTGNFAGSGGGMSNHDSSAEVTGCTFAGNAADFRGGGMYNSETSSPAVTNCTFSGNSAVISGGGIHNVSTASAAVTNCILWGGSAPQEISSDATSSATVTYSCVDGGHQGEGNIDGDPLFVDGPAGDLRLREGSPCIDAADGDAAPATDKDGNPRRDDAGLADTGVGVVTHADMGAYEFQAASPASVIIFSPTADAAWKVGRQVTILWTAGGGVSEVRIELSRDGGLSWEDIAPSTPNDRSFTWTVARAAGSLPQTSCRVRVSDAASGAPAGTSGTFVIFSGVWYVDAAASGGDGLSWGTAFSHPQDAMDAASPGHEVWVAGGTYARRDPATDTFVLWMRDGVAVYGGFSGTETMRGRQVGLRPGRTNGRGGRDLAANESVLDGGGACSHVVVGASNARLDGFTVTGGNASGPYPGNCGGGMFSYAVTGLTVANCAFAGNSATDGGGMYSGYCALLAVTNCTFAANSASSRGGGMYNSYCASLTVTNCTLAANSAVTWGGGICNFYSSPAVANCILWGDSASNGPEIYDYGTSSCTVAASCVDQAGYAGSGGNIDADPLLLDAASGDFRLSAPSPCIDAADGSVAPEFDMLGRPRSDAPDVPNAGTGAITYADMGAFEFQAYPREKATPFGGGCAVAAGGRGVRPGAAGRSGSARASLTGAAAWLIPLAAALVALSLLRRRAQARLPARPEPARGPRRKRPRAAHFAAGRSGSAAALRSSSLRGTSRAALTGAGATAPPPSPLWGL